MSCRNLHTHEEVNDAALRRLRRALPAHVRAEEVAGRIWRAVCGREDDHENFSFICELADLSPRVARAIDITTRQISKRWLDTHLARIAQQRQLSEAQRPWRPAATLFRQAARAYEVCGYRGVPRFYVGAPAVHVQQRRGRLSVHTIGISRSFATAVQARGLAVLQVYGRNVMVLGARTVTDDLVGIDYVHAAPRRGLTLAHGAAVRSSGGWVLRPTPVSRFEMMLGDDDADIPAPQDDQVLSSRKAAYDRFDIIG